MLGNLLARTIDAIDTSPLTDTNKRDLLSYVVAGEYVLAVEALCARLCEQRQAVSREYFLALKQLCGDLEVPRGHLEPVAECCVSDSP